MTLKVVHRGTRAPSEPARPPANAENDPVPHFEEADRKTPGSGLLILNADDWGRDRETTDSILECVRLGAVSSASAMLFMEDSERAAALARESRVDTGVHLNLTTPFTASLCPQLLRARQEKVVRFLRRHPLARVIYHPGLARHFEYVVAAQLEEYHRLYGAPPARVDGHHHMHLCANVLLGGLLPPDTIARRNFSFQPGEKSWGNRLYRRTLDRLLARRHRLTDFFFSLPPLQPEARLQQIFSLARRFTVEVETHPVNPQERAFLAGGELFRCSGGVPVAPRYALP
jgi:hypothetical protein